METIKIKTTGTIRSNTIITLGNKKYYPSYMIIPANRELYNNFDKDSRITMKGISYYKMKK